MTMVTAKQLRENLSQYLDRMEAGEEVAIIRHSEIIGSLKPEKKKAVSNGPKIVAAIEKYYDYLEKNNIKLKTDPDKSAKELYHEILDEKYGLK